MLLNWRQADTNNRSYSITHTPAYGPQDKSTVQLALNDSHDADPSRSLSRFLYGSTEEVTEQKIEQFIESVLREWDSGVRDQELTATAAKLSL
jgi:hypothetical protein